MKKKYFKSQSSSDVDSGNNMRDDIKSMMLKLQDQVIHHMRLEEKMNEEEKSSMQVAIKNTSESSKLDRLEREIDELRAENDILKKAIDTFKKS